jgi:hypothetical protein
MARNRQHETLVEEIVLATEHNFDEKAYLLSNPNVAAAPNKAYIRADESISTTTAGMNPGVSSWWSAARTTGRTAGCRPRCRMPN